MKVECCIATLAAPAQSILLDTIFARIAGRCCCDSANDIRKGFNLLNRVASALLFKSDSFRSVLLLLVHRSAWIILDEELIDQLIDQLTD